ncbi:hypothetical protein ACGFYQ_34305 [Streptomyces sp. NPDC048258]|uniref:hypothetical protein n=1 Tax=Streptomyces sp. NPDC048258 TaxID=3365527 RepID=UPI00371C618B
MTPEILARITAARAARDLSDLARQAVGTTAAAATPSERLIAARRLRQMANEIIDRVVLAEALGGTEWPEIASALGRRDAATVEGEYAESVEEWRQLPAEVLADGAEDARHLDAWYARHREDCDPDVETPASDLFNRR